MRNDKERRDYVENPNNWKTEAEYAGSYPGALRVSSLTYGDEMWFKVEIIKLQTEFDFDTREHIQLLRWVSLGVYQEAWNGTGFSEEHWSTTQIVNRIKEIDREEVRE